MGETTPCRYVDRETAKLVTSSGTAGRGQPRRPGARHPIILKDSQAEAVRHSIGQRNGGPGLFSALFSLGYVFYNSSICFPFDRNRGTAGTMSLSKRLFMLGGLTLLPIIASEVFNVYDLRRSRNEEAMARVVAAAADIADKQQRIYDGLGLALLTLSQVDAVKAQDAAACSALLRAVQPTYGGIEAIGVTRLDGSVFCASDRENRDTPLASVEDRPYFRRALEEKRLVVGDYAFGRQTRTHVVHLARPYRDPRGEIAGVVFVALGLDWLARQLDDGGWSSDGVVSIADRNGVFLMRQPDHERYVGRPVPEALWRQMKAADAPGNLHVTSPLDGIDRIVGFVPRGLSESGSIVAVGVSHRATFHELDMATVRAGAGIALGIGFAVLSAWFFGRKLIREPLSNMVAVTRRWRAGDYTARTGLAGPSEFGQLGAAFDAMAEDLVRAFEHKDVLFRELNHRVMNSLQTISSLFQLQARRVNDPEARRELNQAVGRINSVALAYRRMSSASGIDVVDFTAFARELAHDLSASLLPDGCHCAVEADPLLLDPDQAMPLALILNEFITNAAKHGCGGTGATVTVKIGRSSDGVRMAVRNAGSLPADYHIETRKGFGIQMANAMARQLDGRLEAASMAGETEFAITFAARLRQPAALQLLGDRQTVA